MSSTLRVVVPAVGESVQEGMISKWRKNDGDPVKLDDVLVELETDKASVEIVAEGAGVFRSLRKQGEVVKVGDLIAEIIPAEGGTVAVPPATSAPNAAHTAPAQAATPSGVAPAASSKVLSPAVQRLVSEHKLDSSAIAGTGKDGRLTKGDVIDHLDKSKSAPAVATAPSLAPLPAAPSKISSVPAGPRGVRREPMSMLRRRIAERLLEAQDNNAILTTFNEVDMSAVMKLRAQYKDSFKERHGIGLGFMSFFVKASVASLKQFPLVNGHIDGTDIVYHDYVDVGVAISTDRGLMVPVLRNCDQLSFAGIEKGISDYAQKARAGKISIDDLQGGTFTVTNGGTFGSLLSTPIINPPQSAILGMHKIQDRPMVVNGEIVVRPMMYLALSYDHRIIDGKEAVGFLVKVKELIEDPSRLMLEV